MASKYLLFYSKYDTYSHQVLSIIQKSIDKNDFLLICRETHPNLPAFVDRIPIIYVTATRQLIADEHILEFLTSSSTKSTRPGKTDDLMTYNDVMSASFCYLDETGTPICSSGNFSSLTDFDTKISTPTDGEDSRKSKKADSSMLEKYMAQRESDIVLVDHR
jgi:hypothetical protein